MMRRPLLLLIIAGAVVMTACGSDDDAVVDDTTSSETTDGAAPETPPPTEPTLTPEPDTPAPGDYELAVAVPGGSVDRRIVVHAPPSYDPETPAPLVLVFHGQPGSPEEMIADTGMNAVADDHGFVVAYPENLSRTEEVEVVIDHLVERWGVDAGRVHAAGFSRGAGLVYGLAQDLADRLASVAPVSGVRQGTIEIVEPISLLTFQGGRDTLWRAFAQLNEDWAAAADCGAPTETAATIVGGPAMRTSAACAGDTEHVVYQVPDMGHDWPPEASELIWEFFAAHPGTP